MSPRDFSGDFQFVDELGMLALAFGPISSFKPMVGGGADVADLIGSVSEAPKQPEINAIVPLDGSHCVF